MSGKDIKQLVELAKKKLKENRTKEEALAGLISAFKAPTLYFMLFLKVSTCLGGIFNFIPISVLFNSWHI